MNIIYSAKYNRTERLCAIFGGSGLLCDYTTLYVLLLILFKDATIRPVLKHGPRSSTGLRVVEYNIKLTRRSESKICAMYNFLLYCSTG